MATRCALIALDVQKPEQAQAAVQAAVQAFGRIDVVVNNAGYGNIVAIEESTEAEFRDQIETNLWGVINVTRAALPVLRAQRSGHIFQISSIGGRIGTAGLAAYQTAKWGVEELLRGAGAGGCAARHQVLPLSSRAACLPTGPARRCISPQPGADYQASVGAMLGMLKQMEAMPTYGSDVAKVAQAIQTVVDLAEPPLRLLVGSDALRMAVATDERKLAETRRWQELSASTDIGHADHSHFVNELIERDLAFSRAIVIISVAGFRPVGRKTISSSTDNIRAGTPMDRIRIAYGLALAVRGVWHIAPAEVLRQAGLPQALFEQERIVVSTAQWFALWKALATLNSDPSMGPAARQRCDGRAV